jgi:hypothetical protein
MFGGMLGGNSGGKLSKDDLQSALEYLRILQAAPKEVRDGANLGGLLRKIEASFDIK